MHDKLSCLNRLHHGSKGSLHRSNDSITSDQNKNDNILILSYRRINSLMWVLNAMTQISTFNSLSRSDSICLIREKITSDVCHEVKWKLKRLQIFERNLKWFWSDVTNLLSFTSDFRSVSNSFRFFFTFTETNSIISSRSHEGEKVSSWCCLKIIITSCLYVVISSLEYLSIFCVRDKWDSYKKRIKFSS